MVDFRISAPALVVTGYDEATGTGGVFRLLGQQAAPDDYPDPVNWTSIARPVIEVIVTVESVAVHYPDGYDGTLDDPAIPPPPPPPSPPPPPPVVTPVVTTVPVPEPSGPLADGGPGDLFPQDT